MEGKIYEANQACTCFSTSLATYFTKHGGSTQSVADPCVFIWNQDDNFVYFFITIHDFLAFSNGKELMTQAKPLLAAKYNIKFHGKVRHILKWRKTAKQTHLTIYQPAYTKNVIQELNMLNCKPAGPHVLLFLTCDYIRARNPHRI